MPALLPAWLTDAADGIRRLADRPWTLFALLLACNAVARPCSPTSHDARLYSLQALNFAEHGAYADDVFLRYGSQDQFTLFSRVVGPMVAAIGVRAAFFLLYVIFNTLFIFAMFRLIRALIDDSLIATLALVYLVSAPLNYGGHNIFTVHEQFFTPRIIGSAFTLFALERTFRNHFVSALALLFAGALLHPLMAFGGVMIWAGYLACTYLPTRAFIGLTVIGIISGTAILAVPAIGTRVFGELNDDWHHMIRVAVCYNYPDTWNVKDWINLGVSFALPIAACFLLYREDPQRRRFFIAVTLAGAVGFLATLAASYLPYALLFQGQPYRVLWILKVLQVPLGFLFIARWSLAPSLWARIAALALVAFFAITHYLPPELLIFALALPISIILSRFGADCEQPGWWWYAAARGFVLGALGWMLFRCGFFVIQRQAIFQFCDLNELVMVDVVSPIFCLGALAVGSAFCQGPVWNMAIFRWSPVAVALLTPLLLFAMDASPQLRRDHTRLGSDMAFLRAFVQERGHARPPAIYCASGRPDLLWIDVGATSYFDILQTAGVMFNEETAEHIFRRCPIVAKFEMNRQRDEAVFVDDARKVGYENLFGVSFDCPSPTQDDLLRLCQERGLDYVVIPHEFPGLYSASNGRFFVYECNKVKSASLFSARSEASAAISPSLPRKR